ncbi:MAG: oxidoreductase, partial [Hoylesella buccalis]
MNKVIIMGASSGMGKELAQLFYDAGWNVGIAARRIDCLNKWREENLSRNFSASNGSQARTSTIYT